MIIAFLHMHLCYRILLLPVLGLRVRLQIIEVFLVEPSMVVELSYVTLRCCHYLSCLVYGLHLSDIIRNPALVCSTSRLLRRS